MDKETMIIWGKEFVKQGNKLRYSDFKTPQKNNLPFCNRKIIKLFGNWRDFVFNITRDEKIFIKPQKSQIVECDNCQKSFRKDYNQIKKSKRNFCCRSCLAVFYNKTRQGTKVHSEETKQKIRESLAKSRPIPLLFIDVKVCFCCQIRFEYNANKKEPTYCSRKCSSVFAGRIGGRIAASRIVKRSKNEIYFAELCIERFGETSVLTNEPMFDGWDADVIIPSLKVAILWNGIWHYKKVREKHSLKQVQSRDTIKEKIIRKYEYVPYVIKDMGKYDKTFVEEQFTIFIQKYN